MEYEIERDNGDNNLDVFNYIAIELLEQLNCFEPPEKLIVRAESLLRSMHYDVQKHYIQELD